jgi:hypothetical protein
LQSLLSPSPLYNGTTLLLRHACGANYVMAVVLIKSVRIGTASVPNHFKHYKGSTLRPVLLLALKCFDSTCCTSETVSNAVSVSLGKTKSSAYTYSLKNKFWLNYANLSADIESSTSVLPLNIPQNLVG